MVAFWSITVYTQEKLLYANALNRYAFTGRDVRGKGPLCGPGAARSPPGHLDLATVPGEARSASPAFRTYLPQAPIRDGDWQAPPVQAQGLTYTGDRISLPRLAKELS